MDEEEDEVDEDYAKHLVEGPVLEDESDSSFDVIFLNLNLKFLFFKIHFLYSMTRPHPHPQKIH